MVIAIDESGSFAPRSDDRQFFVAVHLRQRKTLYKLKQRQFTDWEATLPRSLKNAKGEIKSSRLPDDQLTEFAQRVVCAPFHIGITPFTVRPADNPDGILEKHRALTLTGIREGTKKYLSLGRHGVARTYEEFGNWFEKLSYAQYLKIIVLGECIAAALVNTVGHAISGRYDDELPRMRFLIDKDFVREPRHSAFWHELLRNQLYHASQSNPIPVLSAWKKKGHPFLDKYTRNGQRDYNELFWKRLQFVPSHDHFEIRIADAVSTIVSRFFNQRRCLRAYDMARKCFCEDGRVRQLVLNDISLGAYRYDPSRNPWRQSPNQAQTDA